MRLLGLVFALLLAGATGVGLGVVMASDRRASGCAACCDDCSQQAGA